VLDIIRASGAIDAARAAAWNEAQRAVDAARELPDNAFSAALVKLATDLQTRQA